VSLNVVTLVGRLTEASVKLAYRENGTPEARWTLMLQDMGKDGGTFKLFCPLVAYGAKAEECAERLEPGDLVTVQGKLGWHKPPASKRDPEPVGKLTVLAWQVEKIETPAPAASAT
jgi:single-stranded DNA-binding protein